MRCWSAASGASCDGARDLVDGWCVGVGAKMDDVCVWVLIFGRRARRVFDLGRVSSPSCRCHVDGDGIGWILVWLVR
jgi:hypothetical protein